MKIIEKIWKENKRYLLNANFLKKNIITSTKKNNSHWLQNILKM